MMILSLLLFSTVDMGKSYKSFQCWVQNRPRDCVISAQLLHCEKFLWATVARGGKHCLLGSFLFVIASPGIRHPGLPIIDSQSQNYEYSGVWCVVHMAAPWDRRGQSGTGLLLDDSGSHSHALYQVYMKDQSIGEICCLAAVRVAMFCCVMIVRSHPVEYQAEGVLVLGRQADLCVLKAGRPTELIGLQWQYTDLQYKLSAICYPCHLFWWTVLITLI